MLPALLVFWVLCGFVAGSAASGKGQPFGSWFFVGCLLGPLGVLLALTSSRTPEAEAARQKAVDDARRQIG